MIKNKKISLILVIVNIVYLFVLTFIQNPLKENYSMLSNSLLGYFVVFIMCVLMSINLLNTTYVVNRKYFFLSFGPIVGALFPYQAHVGDAISNIHEVLAYVSFFMCMILTILNIYKYKTINYKKAFLYEKIFIVIFVLDIILFLQTMGVVGIEELILLTTILIINYLIIKKEWFSEI